jgi:GntR family transcriptional regulator
MTRTPKYHHIADSIREQVRARLLRPGERLPAETALATMHRTSVPTVRQAMALLRAEGVIESRHGIGTFVRKDSRLQRRSRNRYGVARGRTGLLSNAFRHEITGAGMERVPLHIAGPMDIKEGTRVVVRRRRLYDDNNQLQEIGASYLPAEFARGTYLERPKVVPKALFLCVEELTGRLYSTARDSWVARPATVEEAEAFGLTIGSYVVHVVHEARDESGTIIEVSESTWPADRFQFVDEYDIPAQSEPVVGSDV